VPLTRQDRRLAELARRFPTDRPLVLLAQEDQGRIVGGALAFRTDYSSPAIRFGAVEISLGASGPERGFYLRMGYAGRARLRKQLSLSSAARLRAGERRRRLEELPQRHRRRLAARQP
jgi:hypothetical protein